MYFNSRKTQNSITRFTFTLLMGIFLLLWIPAMAGVAPGSDAGSELIKKMGCNKVKSLALGSAANGMTVWLDIVTDINSPQYAAIDKDIAQGIVQRGYVGEALSNLGDLINFVGVIEEVAFGNPKVAFRKASDWGVDYSVAMVTGPAGAAVWGTIKTLSEFTASLNKELLSLNLDTFGDFVKRDPRLDGPRGGDIFLQEYAEWESDERHVAIRDQVRLRRNALIDYANIVLGQKSFPRVLDWRKPKYRNQVRTAANRMMRDASAINKIKQQQEQLKKLVPGMRAEIDILQKFQLWWEVIKGVTCTDGIADDSIGQCLKNATAAAQILPEAERLATVLDGSRVQAITNELDSWDREIDRKAGDLEGDLAAVQKICAAGESSWAEASKGLNDFERIENELISHLNNAQKYAQQACTETDIQNSKTRLDAIQSELNQMKRLAGNATVINTGMNKYMPPAPIDFTAFATQLSALRNQATQLAKQGNKASANRQKAEAIAVQVEASLKKCPDFKRSHRLVSQLPQRFRTLPDIVISLQTRLASLKNRLGSTAVPDMDALAALDRRLNESEAFIQERIQTQNRGRSCLNDQPDILELLREGELARVKIERPIKEAQQALTMAQECVTASSSSEKNEKKKIDPSTTSLPDVVGMGLKEAVEVLKTAGLFALPEIGRSALKPEDVGKVETAFPVHDGEVHAGDQIVVRVYDEAVDSGIVPNTIGMGLAEAADVIKLAGFNPVFELGDDTSDPKKDGTVASQAPAPGVEIEAGKDVTLIVYSLAVETRTVPDLKGLGLKAAQEKLRSNDLAMTPYLEKAASKKADEGKVYKQYPEPGLDVMNGIAISVWVYGEVEEPVGKPVVSGKRHDISGDKKIRVPLLTVPNRLAGLPRSYLNAWPRYRYDKTTRIENIDTPSLYYDEFPERFSVEAEYRGPEHFPTSRPARCVMKDNEEITIKVKWLEPGDAVTGYKNTVPNCDSQGLDWHIKMHKWETESACLPYKGRIILHSPDTYTWVYVNFSTPYKNKVPSFKKAINDLANRVFDQVAPYSKKCTENKGRENDQELWKVNEIEFSTDGTGPADDECSGLLGTGGNCER